MEKDILVFADKVNAFCKSRRNRTQKFPVELKREAVSLLKKYGYSQIREVCSIGDSTLYKWKTDLEGERAKLTIARATPSLVGTKKKSKRILRHTRLRSDDLSKENANNIALGCQFKCGNVHFFTSDPAFLARTLQILQSQNEAKL